MNLCAVTVFFFFSFLKHYDSDKDSLCFLHVLNSKWNYQKFDGTFPLCPKGRNALFNTMECSNFPCSLPVEQRPIEWDDFIKKPLEDWVNPVASGDVPHLVTLQHLRECMLTISNISSLYAHTHWPMYTQFDTVSGVSLQRRIRLFPVSIRHVVNYGPAPSLTGHFSITSKWPYTV